LTNGTPVSSSFTFYAQNLRGDSTRNDSKSPKSRPFAFVDGKLRATLKGPNIVPEFIEILNRYVESKHAPRAEAAVELNHSNVGTERLGVCIKRASRSYLIATTPILAL
jgi:hypothetical protein